MIRLVKQIIKFGVVGFICFFIDYGIMVFLTEIVNINYLMSSGISFTVSVVVNYILSLKYVFQSAEDKNIMVEFIIFILLSVGGLGINQLLMWLCVSRLGIYYMISKIGATAVVMVYNFVTRKIIIER